MKSFSGRILGLGTVLALLAGPAMAQPYYDGGAPHYVSPYPGAYWWHEHREAEWRAHEWREHQRREAWWYEHHAPPPGPYGY
jgi:hypothetical protein